MHSIKIDGDYKKIVIDFEGILDYFVAGYIELSYKDGYEITNIDIG